MRVAWMGLLLLLLPLGAAQTPLAGIEVAIDPFPSAVDPFGPPVETRIAARVPCALGSSPAGSTVDFYVTRAPSWARLAPEPPTVPFDLSQCEAGVATVATRLRASVTDRAPAYEKAPFEIEAIADGGGRANASAVVEATHFFRLVAAIEGAATLRVPPGGSAEFRVRLGNGGNAPIVVEAVSSEAPPGFDVRTFGSEFVPQGEERVAIQVAVPRDAIEGAVVANVSLRPALAGDPTLTGEPVTISLTTLVAPDPARTPITPLIAFAAAVVASALFRRR